MPSITKLGEFGLIDHIAKFAIRRKDVVTGIGDDAAVLQWTDEKYQLLTTDMMAEGVHFTSKIPAHAIGHKAMASNVSDIASMGGVPTSAVISLGLPKKTRVRFVEELYQGMADVAQAFGVAIVGGDTIKSDRLIVNVALLGEVEKKFLTTRKGAKAGDWIFVSGPLGRAWKTHKHVSFTPRVKEARYLVQHFKPSAMIDISDGLAPDLGHILFQSRVGAVIYEDLIPHNHFDARHAANLKEALYDGEDYELLFTVPEAKAEDLVRQGTTADWCYHIGKVTADPYLLTLIDLEGKKRHLSTKGFEHF